jgi:hypothetical protein
MEYPVDAMDIREVTSSNFQELKVRHFEKER